MEASHQVWIVSAGPAGDLHHPAGQLQVSSQRMAEELSQLALGISDVLDRVHESCLGYRLQQVSVDVTFDGQVGFALVGRTGAARTMTLTFARHGT